MELRLIIQSSDNGELEFVDFLDEDDFNTNANDFVNPGCSIHFDGIVILRTAKGYDVDTFPVGRTLKRIF